MSVIRMFTMECDFCGAQSDESFHYAKVARTTAKLEGWISNGKLDKCAACVQNHVMTPKY